MKILFLILKTFFAMKKTIEYKGHNIKLEVRINNAIDTKQSNQTQSQTFTHALSVFVDDTPLIEEEGISDENLIKRIEAVTVIAQQRIDIIDTPADSPLVTILLQHSFTM